VDVNVEEDVDVNVTVSRVCGEAGEMVNDADGCCARATPAGARTTTAGNTSRAARTTARKLSFRAFLSVSRPA